MAFTIPERLPEEDLGITKGERKVFDYLKKNLPEDYLVYYNIPVEGYYPDFIILGPDLGVFVIEVKDWDFNSIKSVSKENVSVCFGNGKEEKRKNPIAQARDYVLKIVSCAEKKKYLASRRELLIRWGYGALFPNIKNDDLEILALSGASFQESLGSEFVFTGDDLKNDTLISKIKNKMKEKFGQINLKEKDLDLMRSVIYPEILISEDFSEKNIIKIIDKRQEVLAKNLGRGHHIIRGVAGSGKTVILLARAKFLSTLYPNWKILVLCYNKALSEFFKDKLKEFKNVEVRTYHSWCLKKLSDAKIDVVKTRENYDSYWEEGLPSNLLKAYNDGKAHKNEYQAILIDEGQDFAQIWYKTVLEALDKKTESLLIALDGSQTIYNRKVSWKSLGIQIIGRTKVLKVNYRNTRQIMESAYELIREIDKKGDFVFEENPDYVVPEKVLRDGPAPEFKKFEKFEEEKEFLINWVTATIKENSSEDIMILCSNNKDEEGIKSYLSKKGLRTSGAVEKTNTPKIVVSTIHSAKGLESDRVLIMDTQLLEKYQNSEAKRLLYIAMTRSREKLCVCYVGNCSVVDRSKQLER